MSNMNIFVCLLFHSIPTIIQCFNSVPPEAHMSTPEIIRFWGYPVEEILATTSDGYFLKMHRIRHGRNGIDNATNQRPIVFLQHGLGCSSSNWVSNLPHQSAAFLFADAGFDVWMGNMRGNTYSKGHRKYGIDTRRYWAFSWDEMAKYDLDAMIDKVLTITNQSSLYYVGHSQGTLTMFSKLSIDPGFHRKIRKFFALAPIGKVTNIGGLLHYLAKFFYHGFHSISDLFGERQFIPNTAMTRLIARAVCGTWSFNPFFETNPLCGSVLFLIAGPDSNQLNMTRIPVFLSHTPAGTSTRNIMHWAQNVRSGLHQAFDMGNEEENRQKYGTPIPPIYNMSKIVNVPTYLYWSNADWLANPQDIAEYLLPHLRRQSLLVQSKNLHDFNHLDFLWGLRAARLIYHPIIDIIKRDFSELSHSN